jgi:hypothetical protein
VDISPPPPGRISTEYHDTSVSWNTPNTTFYAAALDPREEYQVSFTNLGSTGGDTTYLWFDIHAFELWPVGAHENRVGKGVIAGAAVGGGLGLILIVAGAFLWRKKKAVVCEFSPCCADPAPEDPKPEVPLNDTDAGTVPVFPPNYDEGWTAASSAPARQVQDSYEQERELIKSAAYRGAVTREA